MSSSKTFDVTGLGSLAVDFIGGIDQWPLAGTKNGLQHFDVYDGGLTGTALTTVARLGGKAAYIGKAGNSDMSKRAINSLRAEGIDLSMVLEDPESEPIIAVILSTGHDRNVFFRKENLKFPHPHEILNPDWTKKTKVFFTDHVAGDAGVKAAQKAISDGVEVVVDIERIQDNVEELLNYASHIVVGESFAKLYSGSQEFNDQVKALRKKDYQVVVVTRGEQGSNYSINGYIRSISGIKVPVIDTTGCGDVFHGAYAFAIARKMSVEDAVKLANAAAAISAGYTGGRSGIPDLVKLINFMEKENNNKEN